MEKNKVSERLEREPGLYLWHVYHEPADTDDRAQFIGAIRGDTVGQALDNAAQYYEIPPYDLMVKRSDLDPRE